MLLETCSNFPDFELLDTGGGFRLEKWGQVILQRPDPQIIWSKFLPVSEWEKVSALYQAPKWTIRHSIPNPWVISFKDTKFLLKLSPFKHTGIFAEQAAQWSWMTLKIKDEGLRILNLFAYTGGATMVLAKAGHTVTHVDASKPAITWANENHKLNNLPINSVRWILDDVVKFVKRELKRGAKYDGIIMDPPAFGHAPNGKTWKFNEDLPGLLKDCVSLLSPTSKFLIINGYATNSSAIALNNLLQDAISGRPGKIEFGELCLKQKASPRSQAGISRLISTGIFARWQSQ